MKKRLTPLLLALALTFPFTAALAASPLQQERIAASFVIALGRSPSAAEVEAWSKHDNASVSDLVARHQQQLASDAALTRAVANQAFRDTFGREPSAEELAAATSAGGTYTAQMNRNIASLALKPDAYRQVLDRAYKFVVRRGVYDEEVKYWQPHGTLPYTLLVGSIEDWARRNQPGLMVTAGTPTIGVNSNFLTTVRLSTPVAVEARAALGFAPLGEWNGAVGFGRNLIAPGAEGIVTGGRIHFIAAGRENLVLAPTKG